MKLQKKFSVMAANFMADYLDNGYYPVDDTVDESGRISKILGFARYHCLFQNDDIDAWIDKIDSLPMDKATARLDLTSSEACAILDMMSESLAEIVADYSALKKYIDKFAIDADASEGEDDEG